METIAATSSAALPAKATGTIGSHDAFGAHAADPAEHEHREQHDGQAVCRVPEEDAEPLEQGHLDEQDVEPMPAK